MAGLDKTVRPRAKAEDGEVVLEVSVRKGHKEGEHTVYVPETEMIKLEKSEAENLKEELEEAIDSARQ